MSMREAITKHPAVFGGFAIAAIGLATFVSLRQSGVLGAPELKGEAFYTADDGKTYFTAASTEGSPITRDGKEAYRCFVFRCPGGEPFVGYIVRYPNGAPGSQSKPRFVPPAAAGARSADGSALPSTPNSPAPLADITEYRRPGQTTWQSSKDMIAASKITQQRCPDGTTAEVLLTSETPPTAP